MFKFLRLLSRADVFGFPATYDDERNSSFSGFSEPKSGVAVTRLATVRDVSDLRSCKTQVIHRRLAGLKAIDSSVSQRKCRMHEALTCNTKVAIGLSKHPSFDKKLSCRRETERSLSHSRSLKVIRNDTLE